MTPVAAQQKPLRLLLEREWIVATARATVGPNSAWVRCVARNNDVGEIAVRHSETTLEASSNSLQPEAFGRLSIPDSRSSDTARSRASAHDFFHFDQVNRLHARCLFQKMQQFIRLLQWLASDGEKRDQFSLCRDARFSIFDVTAYDFEIALGGRR